MTLYLPLLSEKQFLSISSLLLKKNIVCLIRTGITCSALPGIGNGTIMYSQNDTTVPYDFETIATYQCDEGFDLVGDKMARRTCAGDGSSFWSGQPPNCSGTSITFTYSASDSVLRCLHTSNFGV